MRTKAQIAKILYDNLSDSRWSKLRDALNGGELIAIATDVVYNYELRFRNYHPSNPQDYPVVESKSVIKSRLMSMLPSTMPTGSVRDALITWGVECIYQCEQSILKDFKDLDWSTATSYAAFLKLASKSEYQFPVLSSRPSNIIVQLPAGDQLYPPYSISIQAGTAVFYNVISYSAGDQATLFQGIPYSYNHSKDISEYVPCTEYETKIITNDVSTENRYFSRYISLPPTTLPSSVHFFTDNGELERWTVLDPSGDKFKLYNQSDGTLAVRLSDNTSWGQDFLSDAQSWCVRFLSLTDLEFDESSLKLPEGYILLSYQNAVANDLEFTRQMFVKYMLTSCTSTYSAETIRLLCLCFPGVQDCSVYTVNNLNYSIYVKPTREANNIIFTELEDFLNKNLPTLKFTTYCADYVQFMFIICADISLSLKSQISAYLQDKYSYTNMKFADTVDSLLVQADLESRFNVSQYDPNFSVSLRIKHGISSFSWVDDPDVVPSPGPYHTYEPGSISIYGIDGEQVGWDNAPTNKVYCTPPTKIGEVAIPSSIVLASNTSYENGTSDACGYDLRSNIVNDSVTLNTLYNHRIYLGGNCAYAFADAGEGVGGTLYIYPLNSDYFKNPGVTFNPLDSEYAHAVDASLRNHIKQAIDASLIGSTIFAYDGDSLAFMIYPNGQGGVRLIDVSQQGTISFSSTILRPFKTSDVPTAINYYQGKLYISVDDGSVVVVSNYTNPMWSKFNTLFFNTYHVQDSFGEYFTDLSGVKWKFTDVPNFSLYVAATGDIQVILLDAEDPGTTCPDQAQLIDDEPTIQVGTYSFKGYWNNRYVFADDIKRRVNSKWHIYSADRFKVTAKGLELINLQELNTIKSYIGTYGMNLSTTEEMILEHVPLWGPVVTGGVDGSVFSYGQLYYQFWNVSPHSNNNPLLFGAWIIDTTTGYISSPDPNWGHIYFSTTDDIVALPVMYFDIDDSVGTYTSGPYACETTLTGGEPLGKIFVAEMQRACALYNRYAKLDETKNIVWVS